jgi:glycogen debranching enzyme
VSFLELISEKWTAYLAKRDIDSDYLLEQDHNEDWMDSIMRIGKIVYGNASWILALRNFAKLLKRLDNLTYSSSKRSEKHHYHKAAKISWGQIGKLADKVALAVDQKLWSEEDGSYIDIQQKEQHIGGPYRTLTQDVVLYLIATTKEEKGEKGKKEYERQSESKGRRPQSDNLAKGNNRNNDNNKDSSYTKGLKTLDAIRRRTWKKNKWPLVTEVELHRTGPWVLKPYQYHNHTFWPWTTALEMIARSRFGQHKECNILFSTLVSSNEPHIHTFYEWLNPKTDKGEGAYPLRTGISAVRLSIFDILKNMKSENNNNNNE